jgi:predicted ArsR family transcriptional regulator
VFRALEQAGYVERSNHRTGAQGRPPAIFASLAKV